MSLKDDAAYIRSIGGYIVISVALFFSTAGMGYVAAGQDPAFAEQWIQELEILKWIMDLPPLMIMILIFLKNLLACAIAILLGIAAGLVPLLVVTSNGTLMGVVSHQVLLNQGPLYLVAGILPHGVVELPVVLVSIAAGFRLGHLFLLALFGEGGELATEARSAIRFLVRIAAPLLLVAAAIETFITPAAISMAITISSR